MTVLAEIVFLAFNTFPKDLKQALPFPVLKAPLYVLQLQEMIKKLRLKALAIVSYQCCYLCYQHVIVYYRLLSYHFTSIQNVE